VLPRHHRRSGEDDKGNERKNDPAAHFGPADAVHCHLSMIPAP
jgi:hypothetical protein